MASYLRTGQVVRLLIDESSVKGVASFYAQVPPIFIQNLADL